MQIKPVLTALRRHKAGTVLVVLQIALTLAIVCNAMFILHARLSHLSEPTGVDEANLFVIANQWAGEQKSKQEIDAQVRADLIALQQLPGVLDAAPSNSYPLRGSGWDNFVGLKPDQLQPTSDAAVYLGDEHLLRALGVKLVAGRNFRADEIGTLGLREEVHPAQVIVTRALAERLYPHGSALGKPLYSMSATPSTIIGIVDRLQTQSVDDWQRAYAYQSMIWPLRLDWPSGLYYIVRARPGQLAAAMREAPKALLALDSQRIIDPSDGGSFAQIRQRAYDSDRGTAILMGIISAVLLVITAAGIVGLTSFWVGQRRKQIGVRRALGARQRDILSYFLTENLLISLGGVLLGVVLAVSMNVWLVVRMGAQPMSPLYLAAGVLLLLLLGQGAVLAPAMKASRVPPVEATRSV
ncbi:ABC transporter permease [Frateuria terrea]|uniref:Putative ABC transport system permease protein n=1 Tax=Frateuria terrea TaxID=529704 RepID=A0A1H6REU7_9GAMM|nr:FtsX-like permease family protein [Frateuria terrea]SEI50330.1 putative ABC transport system permease protein [Frateuria terrea]SFP15447.1 putative ABC transport system permease protein [Frateuria terrea]